MEQELYDLEVSLWSEETRFDQDYMENVLTEDFIEFGRSGNIYSRQEIIQTEPQKIGATLSNFKVSSLSETVCLVTYISDDQLEDERKANRSSIWVKVGELWKLKFHQGTPC